MKKPYYLKDKDLITLEDGFVYLDLTDMKGALGPHHLREIADYLDQKNLKWQEELDHYFEALQSEHGRTETFVEPDPYVEEKKE